MCVHEQSEVITAIMLSDSPCCACMKHSEVIRAIMLDDSPHVLHHEQRVPIPVVQHRLPVRRDICEHVFPQRIRTRVPLNAFSCEHVFPCVPLNAFAQARSGWERRPGGSARVAGPRDKTERRHDGGTRRGLWVSLSLLALLPPAPVVVLQEFPSSVALVYHSAQHSGSCCRPAS